jgi:Gamma-glutamyl cyclotransferase, AIG2-like
MKARRVQVFFYGLFMDADLLRAKGVDPLNPRPACVRGMRLSIGHRAALVPEPNSTVYGFLMELTHHEIEQVYGDPSVAMYRPEAVIAESADGSRVPALCYNLPAAPRPEERNQDYAEKLQKLARRLGLPDS